ncbi:MAG TPA: oxygenase MpaB family protein [Solirubrobacteraceae bacterium]
MPDAPSYFTDDSMLRRVHREWAVALSAPRALLMQAAHPVAWVGFFASTKSLDAPYERLERTAEVMDTIAFGSKAKADRMTRRVRAMHRRVRGEVDGVPYRADDPELLLWILASLVDGALLVYQRYVGPLTRDERDAYWQDYKTIGHLFGLRDADMPESIEDFERYMADMLAGDVLQVSDEVRRLAVQIVMNPPVPLPAVPLLKSANFATIGLLPERLRRAYGFSWDPVRGLVVRAGAEYTRRVLVPLLPAFIRHVPRARAA